MLRRLTAPRLAGLVVIVPFAALLVAACEPTGTTSPGPLATITVTPNPQSLAISGIQSFVATGRDAGGNLVLITPTWSVVAGGGTINSGSGLFTAGTVAGTFTNTVRATSGGISGFATVTVTALATITVTPNPGTAVVGGAIQFTAEGRDATGAVVPISPAPTWSVVAGGGTINSSTGLFTAGVTPGTFVNTVQATSGGISGFATAIVIAPSTLATITVTPNPGSAAVGGTIQFVATGRDATGAVVPISPAPTWSVVAGGGTINSSTGLFTAGATPGTFDNTVRATSGAISGFATAIVTALGAWQGTATMTGTSTHGPTETLTAEVVFELDSANSNFPDGPFQWRIRTGTLTWRLSSGNSFSGCPMTAPETVFTMQPSDGSLTIQTVGATTRYLGAGAILNNGFVDGTESCAGQAPRTVRFLLVNWLFTGDFRVLANPGVMSGTQALDNGPYHWDYTWNFTR